MADVLHGTTQFANLLPPTFGPSVEGFMRSDFGLLGATYDASRWAVGQTTSFTYPVPGKLTAVAKTSETKLTEHIAASDPDAKATIALTTQYAVPLFFEIIALKQVYSDKDLMMEWAERGAYALMEAFETVIAGVIQSSSTNDRNAGTNNTVTYAELVAGWGTLGALRFQPRDTSLGMSGTTWGLSVADWGTKYTSASERGDTRNFLQTGEWGQIGATKVFVSPDWAATSSAGIECATLFTKNSVGWAMQGSVDTLGPTPDVLGGGYEIGLYRNGGAVLAIGAQTVNWNNT